MIEEIKIINENIENTELTKCNNCKNYINPEELGSSTLAISDNICIYCMEDGYGN